MRKAAQLYDSYDRAQNVINATNSRRVVVCNKPGLGVKMQATKQMFELTTRIVIDCLFQIKDKQQKAIAYGAAVVTAGNGESCLIKRMLVEAEPLLFPEKEEQ